MDFGDPVLPPSFWDRVFPEPNTGCWLWAGSLDGGGYGCATRVPRTRTRKTHRLTMGEQPDGLPFVDHLCRVRSCCNPNHLEWVTAKENSRRGQTGWGGSTAVRTHCPEGHEYSEENTYFGAQKSAYTGRTVQRRRCRACVKRQRERVSK